MQAKKDELGFKNDPDFFKKAGQRGGLSTLNIHGKEHFKIISKKAIEKRWGKNAQAIT